VFSSESEVSRIWNMGNCNFSFLAIEVSKAVKFNVEIGHWPRTLCGATTQKIKLHMARGVNPDLSSKWKDMGTLAQRGSLDANDGF
jgi:hypothetical protein